jgi:hypothetical protein
VTRIITENDDPMIEAWLSGESAEAAADVLRN